MSNRPSKSDLRKIIKSTLESISPSSRNTLSNQLTTHLLQSNLYASATTILAYAALPTELNLDPFITHALAENKRICIPTIDWSSKSMQSALIRNLDTDLEIGRYGVRTPLAKCPLVEPNEIDLILIPGLAFDRDLNRLGRGAGFYDRMIDRLSSPRPPLVGICFDSQILLTVPTEPHDHPMDRVITNTGFLETKNPM